MLKKVMCVLFAAIALLNTSFAQSVWLTPAEIASFPTSGAAWSQLKSVADSGDATLTLSDQDDSADITALACAMVYARTGDPYYRAVAHKIIFESMGTEDGGRTLALGRNLAPVVVAADLIGLTGEDDAEFSAWLSGVRGENLDGRTLISTHEDRPNNWGTMCGASRAAAAVYLGDQAELERTAKVFRGFLGDRAAYAGFQYGDLSWQADPAKPVGINPKGATKQGVNIDGVIPDDMRRGGGFTTGTPASTGYPHESLQGIIVQAEILHRAGYPVYLWSDMAILRAVEYLHSIGWLFEGDDEWSIWPVNARYGEGFPAKNPARYGKIMGFTPWSHNRVLSAAPDGDPEPTPAPEPEPTPEPTPTPTPTPEPTPTPTPEPTPTPTPEPTPTPTPTPEPEPVPEPEPTPDPPEPDPEPTIQVFDLPILLGSDDAEQRLSGSIATPGGDIAFYSKENAAVAFRFMGLGIPKNAVVTKAYLQFSVNDVHSDTTTLVIRGRLDPNPLTFSSKPKITEMAKTATSVSWPVPPWKVKGQMGADQRTPDLSAIVQEIIGQSGWAPGNALAFIVTGQGRREANSFESGGGRPPTVLHVEYTVTP